MSKKIALSVLFVLGLALAIAGPAAARPPLCTCPSCATGNANCSLPDGSITTCGVYFGSHCTGPNLAPFATATSTPPAPSCTAASPVLAALFPSPSNVTLSDDQGVLRY